MTPIRIYLDAWHGALHPHRRPNGGAPAAARWQRLEGSPGIRDNVDEPQALPAAKTERRAPR